MRSADIDRCDSELRPDGPVADGGGDPACGADNPAAASDGAADELRRLRQERDEYLDLARRARAEFENYRKRTTAQQAEQRDTAAADVLASVVVPALDVLEAGLVHHPAAVEPIYRAVRQLAEGQGLERLDPAGAPFRPEEHEAVVFRDDTDAPGIPVAGPAGAASRGGREWWRKEVSVHGGAERVAAEGLLRGVGRAGDVRRRKDLPGVSSARPPVPPRRQSEQ